MPGRIRWEYSSVVRVIEWPSWLETWISGSPAFRSSDAKVCLPSPGVALTPARSAAGAKTPVRPVVAVERAHCRLAAMEQRTSRDPDRPAVRG